ncbi:MAG: leucyl aminopeptidase [Rhodospirillaceae bacterium]|jgi:leucyl aminopeptidase|nr:leucyl aminopeptidase [Rhodospirillaceae bacterium]
MKINFVKNTLPTDGALVVGILDNRILTPTAQLINKQTSGMINRVMMNSRFEGKRDQFLLLSYPTGLEVQHLLLIGLGKAESFDVLASHTFGGNIVAQLLNVGDKVVTIAVDDVEGVPICEEELAANIAFGAKLRSYRFDKYRTKEKIEEKPSIEKLVICLTNHVIAKRLYTTLDCIAEGVFLTRNLVSEPANIIYPESLANQAKALTELGVVVEVFGKNSMKKFGMGALLGVGHGSERESQLVVMQWIGNRDQTKSPVAFIGKGVTFDSGGISIKPANGMEEMKSDMAGSAVIIGLMKTLALRKAKTSAIGVIGLVENMLSGTAQRPGDVITTMSGQTVEVINTDAEGRLVLADVLWYTQNRFNPQIMIDLATLTGAIVISLGDHYAGLFANDNDLATKLLIAGKHVNELLWQMPLDEFYDDKIKSDIADMKNTGDREGSSITAAMFLKRFVKNTKWAHLDIAGVTWSKSDKAITPKGATAFGVRLLDCLISENYENK